MAGEDEKKCLEEESAAATTTTVTAKDKIKQFEKVNSEQKVVSMERQRSRAKFEARRNKFQQSDAPKAPQRQVSATDVKNKADYFKNITCSEDKDKESRERKESFQKTKSGFTASDPNAASYAEMKEKEEKEKAEEERVRKESFQKMKSGFEDGVAAATKELTISEKEEEEAAIAAEEAKAEEERVRKESFKEKTSMFQEKA